MTKLEIIRPDDWHVHLRDGPALHHTVSAMARYFGRCIVMPNLLPPIINTKQALAYRDRIINAQHNCAHRVEPLMVIYLTDKTTAEDIHQAKAAGMVAGKLYPAGGNYPF